MIALLVALVPVCTNQEAGIAVKGLELEALETARKSVEFSAAESAGVFVGVNEFLAPDGTESQAIQALHFAVDDAIDLAHLFVFERKLVTAPRVRLQLAGKPAKEESVRRLRELEEAKAVVGGAGGTAIQEAIRHAKDDAGARGLLVVAYSSHGTSRDGHDVLFAQDTQMHMLDKTAVPLARILEMIGQTLAKRRLVLLDACRNQAFKSGADPAAAMQATFVRAMRDAHGLVVLGATVTNGFSFEDTKLKNGVFTAKLIEGLRGAAPGNLEGLITAETLAKYVDGEVKAWVEDHAPAEIERSSGITMNTEDQRSKDLPLSVNVADYQRAAERRTEFAQLRTLLREALDFEILRGEHAQALYELLIVPGERATEVGSRLRATRVEDRESVRAFVAWWETQPEAVEAAHRGAPPSSVVRPGLEPFDDADTKQNDDRARASKVSCRASLSGHVGASGDPRDVYVFAPEEDGLFVFTVQNQEDPSNRTGGLNSVVLTDDAQRKLDEVHPSNVGPGRSGTSSSVPVSAGKAYFLELAAPPGQAAAYSLACALTPLGIDDAQEPDGAPRADLPPFDLEHGLRAKVGFGKDTEDWHVLVAPDHGLLTVTVSNLHTDRDVRLGALAEVLIHDADMNRLASIHPNALGPTGQNSSPPIAVSRGVRYLVKVAPAAQGAAAPYRIDADFRAVTISDQPQRNDVLQTAIPLDVGHSVQSIVGFAGDQLDFYRVDAKENGMLEVSLHNMHQSVSLANGALSAMLVLNAEGKEVVNIHPSRLGPTGDGSVSFKALQGATYYFRVQPADPKYAVPYELSLRRL